MPFLAGGVVVRNAIESSGWHQAWDAPRFVWTLPDLTLPFILYIRDLTPHLGHQVGVDLACDRRHSLVVLLDCGSWELRGWD